MIETLCILGRQPALGLAELESLYGAGTVSLVASGVAGLDLSTHTIDFDRLGGSTKLAQVLGEVPGSNWKLVEKELTNLMRSTAFALPDSGKFHLGLSAIGFDVSPAKLGATGLTLKKILRSRHDGSIRLVPNTAAELSSAQVYHNHLADENGAELLIVAMGSRTLLARTVAVQDIDSYTLRDRGRPKRDARVGMLPPKLAQIIINLAAGMTDDGRRMTDEAAILDPFCGTGVVLQEALLMGYDVYGTDLEPRMIDYTRQNLDWLKQQTRLESRVLSLEAGDATTYKWDKIALQAPSSSVTIACETYLGRPFTTLPDRATLEQTVSEVNTILKKYLRNIHGQLASGSRLCLAVPAWNLAADTQRSTPSAFRHIPLLDSLEDLGYNRVEFESVSSDQLLYYREGQIVARELLVLTVK